MVAAPIGVVLLNLGGPAREAEIEDFLRSLLSDPDVLPAPWPIRPLLARRIARKRAPRVAEHYRAIGGGSPIETETRAQVEALANELGQDFAVRHAFRHGPPFADTVVDQLANAGVRRVVALPAYPQWSRSTTGSALADLARAISGKDMQMTEVRSYPEGPGYIAALADLTRPLMPDSGHLVFSAHGLPQSMVDRGDPYPHEVGRTVKALTAALGITTGADASKGDSHSLAYQSRMGKVEWTRPYLRDEISRLGKAGVTSLLVVPLSFVCENLETRYELDIEMAKLAKECGITSFRRVATPGCHPEFIQELARLVSEQATAAGWKADGHD
jgi:ferrochelatase